MSDSVVEPRSFPIPVGVQTTQRPGSLDVFGRGEFLGALFAALLGALSITTEIRHGTIRPTFLFTPRRGRVLWAKVWASVLIGAGFGLGQPTA